MLPLRSAVEREAQTIATWPALGSPSDPTPILPALEGQATLSRFIHYRWWGEFMSLPPFLLAPHTRPIWTTQWLSTDTPILTAPHPTCTHSFKFLGLKNRAEWFFSLPTKPRVTNGSLTKTRSLGSLTPPRNGLDCPRSGFSQPPL